ISERATVGISGRAKRAATALRRASMYSARRGSVDRSQLTIAKRLIFFGRDPTRTSIARIGRTGPGFLRSQRLMISAGYGRNGRPAHALLRACTASRWYRSTWFNNRPEMAHDARLSWA